MGKNTKQALISDCNSCWNRAQMDEPVFVLMGRDECAMTAIHAWIKDRTRLGKNTIDDPQIRQAMDAIREIELYLDAQKRKVGEVAAIRPRGPEPLVPLRVVNEGGPEGSVG